jgi:hypothetical protein
MLSVQRGTLPTVECWLIQLLDPDVTYGDLRRHALDFDADQAWFVIGRVRVVIDINRHQLTVDYMDKRAAPGHDQVLSASRLPMSANNFG